MSAEPDEYTAEPDGEVQDGAGGDGADVNNASAVCDCFDPSHMFGPPVSHTHVHMLSKEILHG